MSGRIQTLQALSFFSGLCLFMSAYHVAMSTSIVDIWNSGCSRDSIKRKTKLRPHGIYCCLLMPFSLVALATTRCCSGVEGISEHIPVVIFASSCEDSVIFMRFSVFLREELRCIIGWCRRPFRFFSQAQIYQITRMSVVPVIQYVAANFTRKSVRSQRTTMCS